MQSAADSLRESPLSRGQAACDADDIPDGRRACEQSGRFETVDEAMSLRKSEVLPEARGGLGEGQWMAVNVDDHVVCGSEIHGKVGSELEGQPWDGARFDLWFNLPVIAHERWLRSPGINDGRGFSDETIKVYGAMWGKFVRFCEQGFGVSPVLANESVVRAFVKKLHQERVDEALNAKHEQLSQRIRGRDAGGAKRQVRRYLQLLARLQSFFLSLGLRDAVLGNSALLLLQQVGEEPDRPLPAGLPPQSQLLLRAKMGEVDPELVPDDWRALRNRAIVRLVVGSGLTSRQVRHLQIGADHLNLRSSPPYVLPVSARRNQPIPAPVPLSREAADTLRLWLSLREKKRLPGDAVFPATMRGKPMSAASVYRAVAESLPGAESREDMGFSDHRGPRTLRHTFAARQLRAGLPPQVVQRWMGHDNIRSTAAYDEQIDIGLAHRPV